ncbi:ATPase inhibitor, mitochondrial-like [Aethina tumida]|uniref:ATPase inhibitor, mitochondrial-like n=1 Tax=Aethina tumida TaxID=116153 RepID=UPI00096AF9F5|nr:ATPase inhibitor, mitochondrial-like [Aethina tumida]
MQFIKLPILRRFHWSPPLMNTGSGAGKGGGGGGSIREAGGALGKRAAAQEDQYFHNKQQEQIKKLKKEIDDELRFYRNLVKKQQEVADQSRDPLKKFDEEEKGKK